MITFRKPALFLHRSYHLYEFLTCSRKSVAINFTFSGDDILHRCHKISVVNIVLNDFPFESFNRRNLTTDRWVHVILSITIMSDLPCYYGRSTLKIQYKIETDVKHCHLLRHEH